MATIEERAHQYATKKVGGWYTGGFKGSIWQASYDTYIEIATDQRKIDIEKACDFIIRNTTLDRWVNVDVIAEQLRKAMEE